MHLEFPRTSPCHPALAPSVPAQAPPALPSAPRSASPLGPEPQRGPGGVRVRARARPGPQLDKGRQFEGAHLQVYQWQIAMGMDENCDADTRAEETRVICRGGICHAYNTRAEETRVRPSVTVHRPNHAYAE